MKIILINPPIIFKGQRSRITPVIENLFYNSPPLGLAYLAAVLHQEGRPVGIIDAAVERLTVEETVLRLKKESPDVVGITSTTNLFDSAAILAQQIRDRFPHVFLTVGGAHVSAQPEHALTHSCFNVGVIGEGEETFSELIRTLENSGDLARVHGLVLRKNNTLIFTPPRPLLPDLDSLPFPARHLLPLGRYRPQPNDQNLLPKMSMIASRGCPYGCVFCDKSVFGNRYRSFSAAYICREMESLIREYGARDIAFLDSTFTVSRERVESIVCEILKQKIRVKWTCTVRADIVTREMLAMMKQAGCWRVRIGIESGSEDVLGFIKKGITLEQVKKAVGWASELGLQPKGFFMIGHLPDTRETIQKTIRFARSLPLKDITVQINTPMPGTPQFDMADWYGSFSTSDFADYSYWQPVFIPHGLNRKALLKAYHFFYRSFYLRPSVLLRHICSIKTFSDLIKYLKSFKLILNMFFSTQKVGFDDQADERKRPSRGN